MRCASPAPRAFADAAARGQPPRQAADVCAYAAPTAARLPFARAHRRAPAHSAPPVRAAPRAVCAVAARCGASISTRRGAAGEYVLRRVHVRRPLVPPHCTGPRAHRLRTPTARPARPAPRTAPADCTAWSMLRLLEACEEHDARSGWPMDAARDARGAAGEAVGGGRARATRTRLILPDVDASL